MSESPPTCRRSSRVDARASGPVDGARGWTDRDRPSAAADRGLGGLFRRVDWMLSPRRVRLDEVGSFAWRRLDGATRVRTLAGVMRDAFPDCRDQLEERLGVHLRVLRRLRLIAFPDGQTGSGKTHTLAGMEERFAKHLFRMISDSAQVKVQFIELVGKGCKDLLGSGDVKLVDRADGSVQLLNALSVDVNSPEELFASILHGKRQRATQATAKNSASSRSHAVCQITVIQEHENVSDLCEWPSFVSHKRRI